MSDQTYNVLFLCTGNSARSIMAESLLNHLGRGRFKAFSAGSHPGGKVNPIALRLLGELGLPVEGLRSKSWNEFACSDAPSMDFIITVCDNAAGEVCPIWPGRPATAHWGVEDPAGADGTDDEKMAAFRRAFAVLEARVRALVAMQIEELSPAEQKRQLRAIGETGAGKEVARA